MKPLKALISKKTLHRAHVSGKWSPASNFKLSDLKEGYLVYTKNGLCYVYAKTSMASKIVYSISTQYDYVFIRNDRGWNKINNYENFPYNRSTYLFDIEYVYAEEVNFKNSDELEAYLIYEIPEILKKLKAE